MPKPTGEGGPCIAELDGDDWTSAPSPKFGPFRKSLFLPWGCLCPHRPVEALVQPRNTRVMPINERRQDDIVAAIAAYDSANPKARLPRNAARLLAVMFPSDDVCQRSLQDLAGEGFNRKRLPAALKHLVEAGFLSRQPGSGVVPDTYQLHLPSVRR